MVDIFMLSFVMLGMLGVGTAVLAVIMSFRQK